MREREREKKKKKKATREYICTVSASSDVIDADNSSARMQGRDRHRERHTGRDKKSPQKKKETPGQHPAKRHRGGQKKAQRHCTEAQTGRSISVRCVRTSSHPSLPYTTHNHTHIRSQRRANVLEAKSSLTHSTQICSSALKGNSSPQLVRVSSCRCEDAVGRAGLRTAPVAPPHCSAAPLSPLTQCAQAAAAVRRVAQPEEGDVLCHCRLAVPHGRLCVRCVVFTVPVTLPCVSVRPGTAATAASAATEPTAVALHVPSTAPHPSRSFSAAAWTYPLACAHTYIHTHTHMHTT